MRTIYDKMNKIGNSGFLIKNWIYENRKNKQKRKNKNKTKKEIKRNIKNKKGEKRKKRKNWVQGPPRRFPKPGRNGGTFPKPGMLNALTSLPGSTLDRSALRCCDIWRLFTLTFVVFFFFAKLWTFVDLHYTLVLHSVNICASLLFHHLFVILISKGILWD